MRRNNKIIIVISIIMIIILAGAGLAYAYIATDIFKSNQELFAKYISQDIEKIEKLIDLNTLKVYNDLKNENSFTSNTNVKAVHSEGGEISNPLNNLSAELNIQKDNTQQYLYGTVKVLYENEEYLKTEIIREEEQYGIRFPEVKQFVTLKQDENLETIESEIGLEVGTIQKIINVINGTEEIVSKDEINVSKEKYLNIITTEIGNGLFEKQADAMITYNNETINTNAYTVSLTTEQVEKILIEILDDTTEIEDMEIPAVKMTVYEHKQLTIRTVIEIGQHKFTIENLEQEGQIRSKINYSELSNDETIEFNFEITKLNSENQEELKINCSVLSGEEEYKIYFISQMQLINNNIEFDLQVDFEQDITTTSLIIENNVNKESDLVKLQSLEQGSYISLSSIEDQTVRQQFINRLKEIVTQKFTENILALSAKFIGEETETPGLENGNGETAGMSQTDINKFNAKFEFYTGEEVSAQNVKMLMDIVKDNISGHAILTLNSEEDSENIIVEEPKTAITIYIEEGKTNESSMTKVLEKIEDNKKYKVLISYKEINGLIDYITITEI